MNKILLFVTLMLGFISSSIMTSCSDDEQSPKPTQQEDKYCLMFYGAGGDEAHDISFFKPVQYAAEVTGDNVALTYMIKYSSEGKNPNHVSYYIGEKGKLVEDESFHTPDDFSIVDPKNLSDFIKRSCNRFPNRKYILIFLGHGSPFNFRYDLSDEAIAMTRSTLYDDNKMMSASAMAKGIADAGIHLDAMIANSCLQGSIEHIAEWEGLADYLLCSPFTIPDVAYDTPSIVRKLENGSSVENALANAAEKAIHAWSVYQDKNNELPNYGTVVKLVKINDLTPLWNVLAQTFQLMIDSMDDLNYTVDFPEFYGTALYQSYLRAYYEKLEINNKDFFENLRPENTLDLPDFIRYAYMYSGNARMAPLLSRLEDVLSDILVVHIQSNGKHDFIFNVMAGDTLFKGDHLSRYRTCRFDRLTGWASLNEVLESYHSAN